MNLNQKNHNKLSPIRDKMNRPMEVNVTYCGHYAPYLKAWVPNEGRRMTVAKATILGGDTLGTFIQFLKLSGYAPQVDELTRDYFYGRHNLKRVKEWTSDI